MEESKNTPEKLQQVITLTKHYGIPFLYECRGLYSRMTVGEQEAAIHEVTKLAILARSMLGDDIPRELEFLFAVKQQAGSKLVYPPYKPAEREKMFLDYWRSIRRAVAKIESLSTNSLQLYE